MHLTNYSLNKFNKEGFVKYDEDNEENASKRSVQTVYFLFFCSLTSMKKILRKIPSNAPCRRYSLSFSLSRSRTHTHTQVMEQLKALGHDTSAMWSDIEKLCLRTLAVKHPHLWQTYHSVVLNEEVSLSPSPLFLARALFLSRSLSLSVYIYICV
jgi:hypothetical protein